MSRMYSDLWDSFGRTHTLTCRKVHGKDMWGGIIMKELRLMRTHWADRQAHGWIDKQTDIQTERLTSRYVNCLTDR